MRSHIQEYLDWKAGYAPPAANRYRIHLVRFNQVTRKPITEIVPSDVGRFQEMMRHKYSESTIAYATMILKDFFLFFANEVHINPRHIKRPKFLSRPHHALTREEYEKMHATLNEWEFWDLQKLLILEILWDTGMRVSELCDLVTAQMDSVIRQTQIETKKHKTLRWVMWSGQTHEHLLRFVGSRIVMNQYPHLLLSQEKRRAKLSTRTVQRWIKEICARAGTGRNISPHSFRHAKAHEILRQGGNVKEIQLILGHSENNPLAAFSYLRLNQDEFTTVANKYL